MSPQAVPVYKIMRQNWLTAKPHSLCVLIAALFTAVMALLSLGYWMDFFHGTQWMAATQKQVFDQHQYWRAWSTLFVHADDKHLLSNSFFFFIFAALIHGYFSWFAFPLLTLFFGGLINLIVLQNMPMEVQLIGMSGAVFWMGGFWLALSFLIDRRRGLLHRSLKTLGIALVLFFPSEAFNPQISYQAHFVGFILGVAIGFVTFALYHKMFLAYDVFESMALESDLGTPEFVSEETKSLFNEEERHSQL